MLSDSYKTVRVTELALALASHPIPIIGRSDNLTEKRPGDLIPQSRDGLAPALACESSVGAA
jgi:hypothetical protein